MKRIAVLASYNGSTFKALQEAILAGIVSSYEVVLVITNNSDASVLQSAKEFGIDSVVLNSKTASDPDAKLEELLDAYSVDLVLLSGYMKLIPAPLTTKYKMINSHPALLPKYGGAGMYGERVHKAVIKAGESESGSTFHIIDAEYDKGEIVLQKRLLIKDGETPLSLEARVKELEKEAVVELFAKEML